MAAQTPPAPAGSPTPAAGDGQGGATDRKKLGERLTKAIYDVDDAYDAWCRASSMQMAAPPNDPVRPESDAYLAKTYRTLLFAERRRSRVLLEVLNALREDDQ